MRRVSSVVGVAAALTTISLLGSPAWGAPCATNPVSVYTAVGFSCNVDGLTFSNIVITPTTLNGGAVSLTSISPFQTVVNGALESGLSLSYLANAPAGGTADVAWTYNVAGNFINDAFVSLSATDTLNAQSSVNEVLSNNVVLNLLAPGTTTATFSPIASLGVIKDQVNNGNLGTASASILQNGFSLVPAPIVGAGLPGLVAACAGLIGLARRRRHRSA
jgi:hypothetical protein